LGRGKVAEEQLVSKLTPIVENIERSSNSDWDIQATLDGHGVTFECKFDIMAAKTGNIAIEYMNCKSGKASGLTATKADYWSYALTDGSIWVVPTEELKVFIGRHSPLKFVDKAGDGNASIMLYRKDFIFQIFTRIDGLSPKELKRMFFKESEDLVPCLDG
jgi:hypothetical protein